MSEAGMDQTAGPTEEDLTEEIRRLEDLLTQALRVFADFEAELNLELRGADPAGRAAIFARRAEYERTLGIEDLVDRIQAAHDGLRALER
jgi:hypothetical protein